MITLDRAISITAQVFENKFDKSGTPYILHPLQVMNNVRKWEDLDITMAALLHDIIEDTDFILLEEKEGLNEFSEKLIANHTFNYFIKNDKFGKLDISKRVYDILNLVTRKKGMSYQDEILRICTNQDAIKVKMGDIEHNIQILRLLSSKIELEDSDTLRIAKYFKHYGQLKKTLNSFS